MKIRLLIITTIFFIVSCKNKDSIPGNVLPRDKMQAVLWDMMRADQFLADYVLNKDTSLKKKTESIKLYQQVLAINDVSQEKFQRSFSFYQSHPSLLKTIMDSIINALPDTTTNTYKKLPVKDSLRKTADSVITKDTLAIKDSIKGSKKAARFKAN